MPKALQAPKAKLAHKVLLAQIPRCPAPRANRVWLGPRGQMVPQAHKAPPVMTGQRVVPALRVILAPLAPLALRAKLAPRVLPALRALPALRVKLAPKARRVLPAEI